MPADANNYDSQNVECQRLLPICEVSSRSPRFAKRTNTNLSNGIKMRSSSQRPHVFDSRLRHNVFEVRYL